MIVRFAISRLLQAVPVLLLVSVLAFALSAAGGSPSQPGSGPLPERYARFIIGAVQGDFGASLRLGRPVGAVILDRLPATVDLAGSAFALSLLLGVPAGVIAAVRRRSLAGRLAQALSVLAASIPAFLSGTVLLLLFAERWQMLPASGRGETVELHGWSTGLLTVSGLQSLVLPALSLGAFQAALLMRLLRDGMGQALESGFIRFARSRGLRRLSVLRHALANALVPVVTASALQFGSLLAVSMVTECVFNWPGIGQLLVQSVAAADVPVMVAYLLMLGVAFLALSVAADLLCFALDPRLRPPRTAQRTAA